MEAFLFLASVDANIEIGKHRTTSPHLSPVKASLHLAMCPEESAKLLLGKGCGKTWLRNGEFTRHPQFSAKGAKKKSHSVAE